MIFAAHNILFGYQIKETGEACDIQKGKINAYRILIGKPKGQGQIGICSCR